MVHKRLPLRYIQIGAVLIALAGIAALLYAMSGAATPRVAIASIEATMNYAYVHLDGQVTRGPSYNSDMQTLTFYIADSTGEIQASSFRSTTRDLIAQKKIPVAGDHVVVEGNLRVREDAVSLNLVSADKLQITHPAAETFNIGDISTDTNLKIIAITGDVREIHSPYKGLTLISVGDASGEVDVAVYSDVIALTGDIPVVQIGDSVKVNGTVTFYKDTPQLALTNSSDLVRLEAISAPATTTRIGDLDASRVGSRVSVQGAVADAKKFSQGLRVSLDDGSGTITVLLWSVTLAQIANADQIKKGAQMQALGTLNEYRGELEIVPNRGSDVQVIALSVAQNAETPTTAQTLAPDETATSASLLTPSLTPKPTRIPTPVPAARAIGSLTTADENAVVVVNGKIASTSSFSSGVRYKLDDGTGTITLILFSDTLNGVKGSKALVVGARVQAIGKVNIFNDALEIVPSKGSDVVLLARSAVPTAAPRTIASITADDVDALVIITGNVTKVENFSKGKYVTVNDGTGEMRLTIFSDVLSSISNQDKLATGAKIIARGKVNLFQGTLELVPDKGGVTIE